LRICPHIRPYAAPAIRVGINKPVGQNVPNDIAAKKKYGIKNNTSALVLKALAA